MEKRLLFALSPLFVLLYLALFVSLLCLLGCGSLIMLIPCPTEDSTFCYWDAAVQGNGLGRSFITLWDGFSIYP